MTNKITITMKPKHLTIEFANKVYDILVEVGGAREEERSQFIYHHCEDEYECREWRFDGALGSGGKYRSTWNGVTYYPEGESAGRVELANKINELLKEIV